MGFDGMAKVFCAIVAALAAFYILLGFAAGQAWPSKASREVDKLRAEACQAGAAEWIRDPQTGAQEFAWIGGKALREQLAHARSGQ